MKIVSKYLNSIKIYLKIWVPDIVPFNLVEEPHYYTPTWDQGHKLIIYDNGNVIYAPQVNYKVSTAWQNYIPNNIEMIL